MKKRELQMLYNSITNIENKYIQEAQSANRRKKSAWSKWAVATACLCLICVAAIAIPDIFKVKSIQEGEMTVIPDVSQSPIVDSAHFTEQQERFVSIVSLLGSGKDGIEELATAFGKVTIGQYTGVYEKVQSVESTVLSESRGSGVSGAEEWYYVSGHTDLQYLIRNENEEYSLWKFSRFDSAEYPYCDVLELVYQIDSADAISEIAVNPARMDNTDEGKAIQERIGTHVITDRKEIDTIYQILSSLTCYGSNHWDMIDYGDVEAPADARTSSHQAVLLGRYLSIVTDYGNEIDGLKYTAVSDMFYEFSGIAYNRLSAEQAESMREILKITNSVDELQNNNMEENGELSVSPSMDHSGEILSKVENTGVSLEDITELQNKVSAAMVNGELPFVIRSAVYENPYRLHIVVTSSLESDLQKLLELDFTGGALEIEYASETVNRLE